MKKMLIAAGATAALTLGSLAPNASAQTCTDEYDNTITCPLAYPGGFTNAGSDDANAATGADATPSAPVATAAADTTTAAQEESAIAFTGAESAVLGYIGAGMVGLGALSLVAARRRSQD